MRLILLPILGLAFAAHADDQTMAVTSEIEKHSKGAEKLADDQDELSADVQQLVIEQTDPNVIELLSEVEAIMDETTDALADRDTGGKTIAAQTEIIEKIHQAAKAKQQSAQGKGQGQGEAGSAMMDMMERMMGKKPGEGKDGKGKAGESAGNGNGGDSDTMNESKDMPAGGTRTERKVPKAAGKAGRGLPSEFQSALDAYNRGLEGLSK